MRTRHDAKARVPRFRPECLLGGQGGLQCIRRRGEDRVEGITDRFEDVAAVGVNRRAHNGVVPDEGLLHRRAVVLPARGAALDVGEQKRDGAGRQFGHRSDPDLNSVMYGRFIAHAARLVRVVVVITGVPGIKRKMRGGNTAGYGYAMVTK